MSVATTYAEALYEAAEAQDAVADVARDLGLLREAVTGDEEVARVLFNPEVDTRVKKDAIDALSGRLSPLALNFANVLLDRGRLEELPAIVDAFERRVAEAEGRIPVEVITAGPLTADLRPRSAEPAPEETGPTPDLTETGAPDLLRGPGP